MKLLYACLVILCGCHQSFETGSQRIPFNGEVTIVEVKGHRFAVLEHMNGAAICEVTDASKVTTTPKIEMPPHSTLWFTNESGKSTVYITNAMDATTYISVPTTSP